MAADLVLHWQLDDLTPESRAIDSSGNRRNGVVEGNPGAQADERFGSCLLLDGEADALTVPDDPALRLTAYTVQSWVKASKPRLAVDPKEDPKKPAVKEPGVAFVAGKAGAFSVSVGGDGAIRHAVPTADVPDAGYAGPPGSLAWDEWHHVAVTCDGRVARTYLDGIPIAQYGLPGPPVPGREALTVGRHPAGSHGYLPGRIAHVRIYDGALSAPEIRRDMAADEAALAAFVRTHPLDFELVGPGGQPVLYIDDATAGQAMTLRLVNSSRQDLELRGPGGSRASADAHHVALSFRAGTLAAGAAPRLATPGWSMLATPDAATFYLLRAEATVIRPGAAIELELRGLRADGAGGTRGTRVELAYRRLGYAGEPDDLIGSRMRYLDVVNHRGRPDIPLDVSFVGGDRVLSDGATPGSLRIGVTNVSRDTAIALTGGGTDAASAFTVSFESQESDESRPWALTTAGRAGDVHLTLAPTVVPWADVREDLGQRMQWTLTPRADTTLPPGGRLELTLDDIYALDSPGHAPIVVAYRNIPGFQDGFVSIAAERTPLLFTASDVAIGVAPPAAPSTADSVPQVPPVPRLTIGAEDHHLQLVRQSDAEGGGKRLYLELYQDDRNDDLVTYPSIRFHHSNQFWHRIEGRSDGFHLRTGDLSSDDPVDLHARDAHARDVYATSLKIVNAPTDANGGALTLGPTDHPNLRLGYHDGYAWIQSHTDKPLAINPIAGNVGIGTTVAPARLTIRATGEHLQLRRESADTTNIMFLELYQADTPEDVPSRLAIRFHHSNRFWHRIEADQDGFHLKNGSPTLDTLVDLHAANTTVNSLTIGDVTIGRRELHVLRRLAAGELEFDLYNTHQGEYAYAGTYTYSDNRRYVFTWGEKNRVSEGRWRIAFPA